jgi:hypothetical protein
MGRLRLVLPISRDQLFLILLSFLILSFVGCSRGFYRKQADHQVSRLLRETSHDPDCELNRHDIRVKRISRMYDPFSPDDPPLPPDDPAAHRLMHCVDCKRGYPCWHASGDTPYVASPLWMEFLPLDEDGILYLDAALAVRLALVNAPAYQSEFETLFLSALDVTAERFAFDKQVFSGTNARYTSDGQRRTGRGVVSSELALPASGLRVEKMFTTGAEMVVGLANSIVWEFSGPDTNATSTLLDFTLVQPLLRRAGRDRIMETLTLSERTLLYNVRQIERFRRGFYLEIVTGRQAERGPTRRGGFFGTSGLTGFTGVGAGGFGGVGGAGGFGFGGGGAGAAQAGGFMGLLQSQQDIRNQESNIAGLRSSLLQLEESLRESLRKISDRPDDILRQRLQIAQARQALVNAQSRLLNSQNQYQGELDQFKLDLGLPPTICLVIDDPLLDQFNLIDTEIVPVQNQIIELQQQVGTSTESLLADIEQLSADSSDQPLQTGSSEVARSLQVFLSYVEQIREIQERLVATNIPRVRKDITTLKEILPQRRKELTRLAAMYQQERSQTPCFDPVTCQIKLPAQFDSSVLGTQRLDGQPSKLFQEVDRLGRSLESYGVELDTLREWLDQTLAAGVQLDSVPMRQQIRNKVLFATPGILSRLAADVMDLSLLQARARTENIRLVSVEIDPFQATEIARSCRRDWKNARGALVDAWRLIKFNANDLESGLDLTFSGDLATTGDNPVKFRSPTGRLRVGLEFDAPLTRLLERNRYRQSLIEYQQARRSYYRFEDRIARNLRGTIRTIDLNRLNFEQQRLAVLGAIDQIVLNDEILTLAEQRGETSGATAARDVVSALADLQNAQNNFLSVWVNYEVLRRNLDLELGVMQLNDDGQWIDPGPIGGQDDLPSCAPCSLPKATPNADNDDSDKLQVRQAATDPSRDFGFPEFEVSAEVSTEEVSAVTNDASRSRLRR